MRLDMANHDTAVIASDLIPLSLFCEGPATIVFEQSSAPGDTRVTTNERML